MGPLNSTVAHPHDRAAFARMAKRFWHKAFRPDKWREATFRWFREQLIALRTGMTFMQFRSFLTELTLFSQLTVLNPTHFAA